MFYSIDILSRRKTGLGIVWLAATLGDRSAIRRLTRKEILSVNITLTCDHLGNPTEPFALRLSSQLLFGVVKLYFHQTELLFSDVSNVHSDVRRRMLTTSTTALTTREIDMRTATKQVEAITLPLDLAFFTLDFDELGSGMLYRWSVEPEERRLVREEGVEDGFRTPTPVRHLAPEERITLPERAFEEEELGLARAYEEEGIGPALEGYEEEEYEGLDLGLEPPLGPEPFPAAAPEGIEPRFEGDETAVTEHIVEWPELEERLAEEAARMEVGPVIEGVPTVTPARRPSEEEEVEARLAPALRPRAPPLPFEDRATELSEAQRRAAQANYPERMAAERAALQRRAAVREATTTARHLIFGPPEDLSLHPALSDLWEQTVSSHLLARRARFQSMRTEANLLPLDEAPPSPPPPTPMEEEVEELGVPRAAAAPLPPEIPAALRGARESLPWNLFAEHRRRSSMLPSISYDREITPLRLREVSIETPTGLRRLPPESPLFIPPPSPSTIAPLEEYPMPETPSMERFRLGLPQAAEEVRGVTSPTPPEVVFEEDLEEETRNFLQYARSIREELEDPSFMFFSDLAPVASSTPGVAAQAFYHLLTLVSGRRMKVKQEESYGEIRVTLLNP